jgi:putative membrane protein
VVIQAEGAGADLPISTKLALDRTRLAHERTLMAWVRTATSLISFGFTIYKFFDYMRQKGEINPDAHRLGPRGFALIMISIGLVALALSTLQHWQYMRTLREEYSKAFATPPYSLATVIAGLVSILGIVTLIAVIFRQ